jgi:malonate transporter and related proteins
MSRDVWRVWPLVAAKLVLHPLAVWCVMAPLLRLDPFWVQAGVLYAALPIAANAFVISERYETGAAAVAGSILLSTVLATLTYPITLWLIAG